MKEVSCKAFTIFFKDMKRNLLPVEILCKEITYDLDYLRNQKNNVEWEVFCKSLSNTRELWNDDDYIRLGHQIVEWRVYTILSAMIGFFLNPKEMYKLLTQTKKGKGTQLFRCITSTFKEIDDLNVEILLELPLGYTYCSEFFLMTQGVFTAAPALIRHKHSHVTMLRTERGALYKILLSPHRNALASIRNFFSLPSSKKAAIQELNDTYELLYDRYLQLEVSQAEIQKQAKQLETAYSISQIISSDLNLDSTIIAVADSLIYVAGFAAVEITIHATLDHETIKQTVKHGNVPENSKPLTRKLEGQGQSIGEINLWMYSMSSAEDSKKLLEYIIPTINIEILNALSFKLVNDYRSKLESKVDEIQNAIVEERRRISSEIHDDLGTNLSAIALMSGVMKEKAFGTNAEKISVAAQQSLEKISEIVWSLNPRNDKMENLLAYIRKYAVEYFDLTPISCKVNLPGEIPDIMMNGEQRRNIFLSVKEALHNVLKHSGASKVELTFSKKGEHNELIIHDNGKGIDQDQANRFGNGLENIKQRMESIGGYFKIEGKQGTIIRLGYSLAMLYITRMGDWQAIESF